VSPSPTATVHSPSNSRLRETAIIREEGETPNDRNDRGMVVSYTTQRKYVEGAKDANQLLDIFAAAGAEDIEPTKAVAGRQAL
jgi:exosome complex exonuclease DIS3/RRP44